MPIDNHTELNENINIKKKRKRRVLSAKRRFAILARDSFTCQYCGKKAPNVILHVDHIIPSSKGGDNSAKNLITACSLCNNGKTDFIYSELSEKAEQVAALDCLFDDVAERGGKRDGSGRKKRWGKMETIRILRVVPEHLIAEIDVAIENVVASKSTLDTKR